LARDAHMILCSKELVNLH